MAQIPNTVFFVDLNIIAVCFRSLAFDGGKNKQILRHRTLDPFTDQLTGIILSSTKQDEYCLPFGVYNEN